MPRQLNFDVDSFIQSDYKNNIFVEPIKNANC